MPEAFGARLRSICATDFASKPSSELCGGGLAAYNAATMPTTEHTINDALAAALRTTRSAWRGDDVVRSENSGMLRGSAARPDILVLEPSVSPVTIETEVLPAVTVEQEARDRLGKHESATGRPILSSIAVRLPVRLRSKQGNRLAAEIASATDIEMALFAGSNPQDCRRWPQAGWIHGTVADLSILAQSASVPPEVIEAAADELVTGVSEAAGLLAGMASSHPGQLHKISEALHQEDGEQTRRMATTILANAFIFQESLAGGPGDLAQVKSLDELLGDGELNKGSVLAEWKKILEVNYWPIFDIARRIFQVIPPTVAGTIIDRLKDTADRLLRNSLMRSHDLTGAIFQKLIADRKFLAAFYTTPASAALLNGLAITPDKTPAGGSWASVEDVQAMRIADLACGTGTLLSTAYQRIGQLHELAGGDSEAIHPEMMAKAIVGCDVFPAAAHLTASMLAGAHPTVKYSQSSILTVAYGRQDDGSVALGSLDLLDSQRMLNIIDITAKTIEGMGAQEKETWAALPRVRFDMVIMNPPFTRATGHHEINNVGVPNPIFAAFNSSEEEQQEMSAATARLSQGTCAHGNAGEASIFLALADRRLRDDGILALVMPVSLVAGDAWEKSRQLLWRGYSGLIVVTISGVEGAELSFSADTNMGECLIVGERTPSDEKRATFVILKEPPGSTLVGASAARQIRQLIASESLRSLEDGPMGGTPLHFGDDLIGQAIDAPLPNEGGWNLARVADLALAQTAFQLENQKRIWLPAMNESQAAAIPITTVGELGEVGPIDRDINGRGPGGSIRGPFDIEAVEPDSTPTYPVLWSHDAERERTMMFPWDSEGQPRRGRTKAIQADVDERVANVWETASHCHFNRDFRFNSQSTALQFTPRRTIGGRSWLSIKLANPDLEKALVLWGNSSLGLLMYWWHANKQQSGRGYIGKSALQTLPVLNVAKLTAAQRKRAVKVFDEMSEQPLRRMYEMDIDETRKLIDERLLVEVLGLDSSLVADGGPVELLRQKLAAEPSVRGSR